MDGTTGGKDMLSLGLMSGTSLDGVDAALIETDGEHVASFGASLTLAYPEALRRSLRNALGRDEAAPEVAREMTLFHAEAVRRLLAEAGLAAGAVSVIGFHGQTVFHRPEAGRTRQIGDGALLARQTGIDVVADFRSADVAAGGQGAPLVPVYHRALAAGLPRPLVLLNLGGVGNVTWIGADDRLQAFDTGPGNALIDDWMASRTGRAMDRDGALAAQGQASRDGLAALMAHPFFAAPPPKSLDRDDFKSFADGICDGLSAADGAATLTAFTVAAVAAAARHFPARARQWLVTGGGRRNPAIMGGLAEALAVPVSAVDGAGWDGDALEAQAFAYLAVRSLKGLPLTWPETTGVPHPMCGGQFHPAPKDGLAA